jgi:hypothetical protein
MEKQRALKPSKKTFTGMDRMDRIKGFLSGLEKVLILSRIYCSSL